MVRRTGARTGSVQPESDMNRHALWEPMAFREAAQVALTAVRLVFEYPDTFALYKSVAGRDRCAEIMAGFYAEDAWENEGGALAYAD